MAKVTLEALNDLSRSLDPVLLAQDAGMQPDPFQTDILRSTAQRLLLLAGRQCGKSTTAALLVLHQALYVPGSLILLVSPSQRQSGEIFRAHIMRYYHNLDNAVPLVSSTQLTCEFVNASRIIALPGDESTVRTYSNVQLIVIDEAARVPDDLYYSVRPMLATSGGRLVCLSTPRGKRGFFYHEWVGEGVWERHETRATDCARISKQFLDEERQAMGDMWFAQEYLNSFNDTIDSVFSHLEIERAFVDDSLQPLFS